MLKAMIGLQWSRVRAPTVLAAVILFSMPLVIVRAGGGPEGGEFSQVGEWLRTAELVGRVIPVLCAMLGLYLGAAAWMDDAKGGHVYALTLPVARERFVVYRFAAAGLPMLIPILGLLAGGILASWAVRLPSGVHAYPVALAGRALLATLVSFAFFFALSIATRRSLVMVLAVAAGLIGAEMLIGLLDFEFSPLQALITLLITPPGPLAILAGHWALFDV